MMQYYFELLPDWAFFILFQLIIIFGAVWLVASALNAVVTFWYNWKEGREGRWTVETGG
ncbi:MAG: hypothetical protein ACXADS_13300 [Candidatus Thorarchaeota archaeon]|jgi:hypothetical protein